MHDTVYQYDVKCLYEFQEAFWIEEIWEYYTNSQFILRDSSVIGDSKSIPHVKVPNTQEVNLSRAIEFTDPERWRGYSITY